MNALLVFLAIVVGWISLGSVILAILHGLRANDKIYMWFCIIWLHVYWFLVYIGVAKLYL